MARILVLADLGQTSYHVGSQAIGIAAAQELSARGHQVVLATRSASQNQALISPDYDYLTSLPFPSQPAEREILLDNLHKYLKGQPGDPQLAEFVQTVADLDGILIAGSGSMNSLSGDLLYEKAAYALIAHYYKIPLVISGQTVGPVLTEADSHTLIRILQDARLVGMRETSSLEWSQSQGLEAYQVLDDSSFYQPLNRTLPGRPTVELPDKYICATFSGLSDSQARTVAHLLDDLDRLYGIKTVFLPHLGTPLAEDGDYACHALIASHMFSGPLLLPIVHADDVIRVHQGAFLNFSTRYHPGVFSLAGGIPFLALLPDPQTDTKVRGLMAQYGAENYAIPLALLNSEAPAQALQEIVLLREELSRVLTLRAQELKGYYQNWWDTAAHMLLPQNEQAPVPLPAQISPTPTIFTGDWNLTNLLVRDDIAQISLAAAQSQAESDRAISWDYQRLLQRDQAQARAEELERQNALLQHSLQEAEENATLRGWVRRVMGG